MLAILCSVSLFSQEPPTVENIVFWAGLPRGFELKAESIKSGEFVEWGEPEWIYSYRNDDQCLYSYVVALYRPGTLWHDSREKISNAVRKKIESGNSLGEDFRKYVHIEKDEEGREIFYTILMFGPGGTLLGSFTFQPEYDLLVCQMMDSEDDIPREQRLKNPVTPKRSLEEMVPGLLNHLNKNRKMSEPVAGGDATR